MANPKSSRRNGSRARHSYSDYRRLSPDENERQGFSRTARHYVLKIVKRLTSRTPSISARAHETLRARQLHGLATPEHATMARREGGISYSSADQASRVEKAADRRLRQEGTGKRRRISPHVKPEKEADAVSISRMRG